MTRMSKEVIKAAIDGYRSWASLYTRKADELEDQLKGETSDEHAAPAPKRRAGNRGKRVLSAAGREAISAAARKRWAAHRKAEKANASI